MHTDWMQLHPLLLLCVTGLKRFALRLWDGVIPFNNVVNTYSSLINPIDIFYWLIIILLLDTYVILLSGSGGGPLPFSVYNHIIFDGKRIIEFSVLLEDFMVNLLYYLVGGSLYLATIIIINV